MELYILDEDRNVVRVRSADSWAAWFESDEGQRLRRIAATNVHHYYVSTVFLGIDHAVSGVPELFETYVESANGHAIEIHRYATAEAARNGHNDLVRAYAHRAEELEDG